MGASGVGLIRCHVRRLRSCEVSVEPLGIKRLIKPQFSSDIFRKSLPVIKVGFDLGSKLIKK